MNAQRRAQARLVSLCFIGLGFVGLGSFGCARAEPGHTTENAENQPPPSLHSPHASWVGSVRRAHQQADQATTREQQLTAAQTLRALVHDRPLPDQAIAPVLAQELAARGARLFLQAGDTTQALHLVRSGLDLSQEKNVARAQLLMTQADCEQKSGNAEAARQALLEALTINQQLFAQELQTP